MILLKIRKSVPALKVTMTQHWSLCSQQCCEMRTQSKLEHKEKVLNGKVVFPSAQLPGWWEGPGLHESQGLSHKRAHTQTWGLLVWAPNSKAPPRGEKLLFPANLPPSISKKIHSELLSQLNEYTYRYTGETQNTHPGCFPLPWDVSLLAMLENLSSSILKV